MRVNSRVVDHSEETAAELQGTGKPTGFENVRSIIADKVHGLAEALGQEAADQGVESGSAYGRQASEWLDQSSEYIRQFDYEQVDARVREYVRQSPGRSLLIAGAVGLIIGAILRRR